MTNSNDMFIAASRNNFTYPSRKGGTLNTSDLWTLPLKGSSASHTSLNSVAVDLSKAIRNAGEESFFTSTPVTRELRDNRLKLEIVKYVGEIKQMEIAKAKESRDEKAQIQKILVALENKENENLNNMSIENLQKALAELTAK